MTTDTGLRVEDLTSEVLDYVFGAETPSAEPTLVLLTGQPGAGSARAIGRISNEHEGVAVVSATATGWAFVLLVAALWEGLTFVPVAPQADLERFASDLQAPLVVAERAEHDPDGPDGCGGRDRTGEPQADEAAGVAAHH